LDNDHEVQEIIVRCQGRLTNGKKCNHRLFDIVAGYDELVKSNPIEIVCNNNHYLPNCKDKFKAVNIITVRKNGIDVKVEYVKK
jgi:hypothetical protein